MERNERTSYITGERKEEDEISFTEEEDVVVNVFNGVMFSFNGEKEIPIGRSSWSYREKPRIDLIYKKGETIIVEAKRGWTINRFSEAVGQLLCYEHLYNKYESDSRDVRKVAVLGKGSYDDSEKPEDPTGWNEHKKIAGKYSIDLYTVTFFDDWFSVDLISGYEEELDSYIYD